MWNWNKYYFVIKSNLLIVDGHLNVDEERVKDLLERLVVGVWVLLAPHKSSLFHDIMLLIQYISQYWGIGKCYTPASYFNLSLFRRNILHVDFITCDREKENASICSPETLRIHLLLAPLSQESVSPHARNGTNIEYLYLNYHLGGRLDWVGLPGVEAQKIQGWELRCHGRQQIQEPKHFLLWIFCKRCISRLVFE